jgi:hypothetical protein
VPVAVAGAESVPVVPENVTVVPAGMPGPVMSQVPVSEALAADSVMVGEADVVVAVTA